MGEAGSQIGDPARPCGGLSRAHDDDRDTDDYHHDNDNDHG